MEAADQFRRQRDMSFKVLRSPKGKEHRQRTQEVRKSQGYGTGGNTDKGGAGPKGDTEDSPGPRFPWKGKNRL